MDLAKTFFLNLLNSEEEILEQTKQKRFQLLNGTSDILKDCKTEDEAIYKLNIMMRLNSLIKDSENENHVKIMYGGGETCLIDYNSKRNNIIATNK